MITAQAQAPVESFPIVEGPLVTLAVVAAAVALVAVLVIWGLRNPAIWRLLSVFAVGGGAGLLVWGITAAAMGEEPAAASPAGLIGIGAGVLVGGIMLLVISFFRTR